MSDKIMIDDELDHMSQRQLLIITWRAARRLGIDAEFNAAGKLEINEGADIQGDEFLEAWEHEACLMVAGQMTARMLGEGLLYVDGVDADGNHIYKVVPDVTG